MKRIHVLILGTENPFDSSPLPPDVQLEFSCCFEATPGIVYEMVILDRTPTPDECRQLYPVTRAYTLFYSERVDLSQCTDYCLSKKARGLNGQSIPVFLTEWSRWFFPGSYGEKFEIKNLEVAPGFSGEARLDGSGAMQLRGSFGRKLTQAAYWRNDIPIEKGQTLDFWLEYHKTPGVELALQVMMFRAGSLDQVLGSWTWTEKELEQVTQITAQEKGFLSFSVFAAGSGTLEIGALHDRYSRGPFGYFIPGGERRVTSDREEIFCYFDPGDRKPPLNVYFSGYRTQEGFEGYNMMRALGAPFLLLCDVRLEGGAYYQGSPEYEAKTLALLHEYMDELGFGPQQVILSGISMGSAGALYYGCDLQPHAVIVGKPLVNFGDIALNERLVRPGGFSTSLDTLMKFEGEVSEQAAQKLNTRFWNKFEKSDWSDTRLIVSYMLEDDYDGRAYEQLIQSLAQSSACIYGRGLHGRHNDNTAGIAQWFVSQYQRILREDFAEYNSEFRQGGKR